MAEVEHVQDLSPAAGLRSGGRLAWLRTATHLTRMAPRLLTAVWPVDGDSTELPCIQVG
jgi:hypothetical protein